MRFVTRRAPSDASVSDDAACAAAQWPSGDREPSDAESPASALLADSVVPAYTDGALLLVWQRHDGVELNGSERRQISEEHADGRGEDERQRVPISRVRSVFDTA